MHLLDALVAQQDFVWFLGGLAWAAVLLLLFRPRAAALTRERQWLVPLAFAGVMLGGLQIVFGTHVPADFHVPRMRWQFLFAAQAVLAAGALLQAAWPQRDGTHRICRIAGVAGLVWALAERSAAAPPLLVAGWIGLLAAGVAVVQLPGRWPAGTRVALRVALLLTAAGPWCSGFGLLASLSDDSQQWHVMSYFGVPAALLWLGSGCAVLQAVWMSDPPVETGAAAGAQRRLLRRTTWVLAAWLLAGFLLASLASAHARDAFERGLLARVRTAARLLPPAQWAGVLGPRLQLTELREAGRQAWGTLIPLIKVPFKADPEVARANRALTVVHEANPDVHYVHAAILREGYFVSALFPDNIPGPQDVVVPHHRATGPEQTDLAAAHADPSELLQAADAELGPRRRARPGPVPRALRAGERVEGPMRSAIWGDLVRARTPLFAPDGTALGWLCFDVGVQAWAAPQAMARAQAFAVTALGLLVGLLAMLGHLTRLARDASRAAAEQEARAHREKTLFLGRVSHELRAPIQAILGNSELLLAAPLAEPHRSQLDALRAHGDLLIRLVNDLIEIAVGKPPDHQVRLQATPLGPLVRQVTDAVRPRALAKKLRFTVVTDSAVPASTLTDGDRLRQILLNLLGNAVKFTAAGHVECGVRWLVPEPTADGAPGGWLEFSVIDTGPGIPLAEQKRIFEGLHRVEATAHLEGVGLGLAISRGLTHHLGGTLEVHSDGQHGSSFTLRLPHRPPPLRVAPATSSETVTVTVPGVTDQLLAGRTILIVEDNTIVRELFTHALASRGASVTTASHGQEALECCASQIFHACVIDLSLPYVDGCALARQLRARATYRHTRLIGVSAHAAAADEARALASGMDAYLVKPVPLETLAAALAGSLVAVEGVASASPSGREADAGSPSPGFPVAAAPDPAEPARSKDRPSPTVPVPDSGGSDVLPAGEPPSLTDLSRPPTGDLPLMLRLEATFQRELPALRQAIDDAIAAHDWRRLHERTHYLKNSADILERRQLQAACAQLEAAAASGLAERAALARQSLAAALTEPA